jgi:hypothetical protein
MMMMMMMMNLEEFVRSSWIVNLEGIHRDEAKETREFRACNWGIPELSNHAGGRTILNLTTFLSPEQQLTSIFSLSVVKLLIMRLLK